MMLFLSYLLKVSVSVAALYLIYHLMLRHYTFHQANRIYLLFLIIFSFVVPLISVDLPGNHNIPIAFEVSEYSFADLGDGSNRDQGQTQEDNNTLALLVVAAYLLGVIIKCYQFVRSSVSLYRLCAGARVEVYNGLRIRRTHLRVAFTFLNTIFLPEGKTDAIILHHEHAHVRQHHWIDLLLTETASIVLWFNPVMMLLRAELRLQHEFLADQSVLTSGIAFEEYAKYLVKKMESNGIPFRAISPLHSSSSKKRIIMMTKMKTSRLMLVVYLVLIPLCGGILMSFGRRAEVNSPKTSITLHTLRTDDFPDIAPVDFAKVTRVVMFGERASPLPGQPKKHTGIDFELGAGSDIVATASGVVVAQAHGEKAGNYVVIRHNDTYTTRYYHLQTALVKKGERVAKGQLIGRVGNTGLSGIHHLHYEIVKNDTTVDPKDYLPDLPEK